MDDNDTSTHLLQIDLVPDSSCAKTCLGISQSQVEDVEAELRLPHVRYSQSRGFAALRHIANCPSNSVRWRRLQMVRRFGDMTQCDQCD